MKGQYVIITHEDSATNKIYHGSSSIRAVPMLRDQLTCHLFCGLSWLFPSSLQPRFLGGLLPWSNLVSSNFKRIHHFSFPVETKAKPLPQCNTPSDFHFEVKTSLKYIDCFNSVVPSTIQNLSEAVIFCLLAF